VRYPSDRIRSRAIRAMAPNAEQPISERSHSPAVLENRFSVTYAPSLTLGVLLADPVESALPARRTRTWRRPLGPRWPGVAPFLPCDLSVPALVFGTRRGRPNDSVAAANPRSYDTRKRSPV
jgi:hypothetical protein